MSSHTQHTDHMEDTHNEGEATMHASAPPVDAFMPDVDVSEHSFVDMLDFNFLVTRTSTLEKGFASLNENVTKMSDLLKELVGSQALGVSMVSPADGAAHGATSSGDPSPSVKAAESLA